MYIRKKAAYAFRMQVLNIQGCNHKKAKLSSASLVFLFFK